jgi:mono/diheme cytochrome c family protein
MRRLGILLLLPLALAGCGPSGDGGRSSGASDPKSIFAGTCGGCHTLRAAGTTGTFGPDLDQLEPSRATVLRAIKTGPGPMPAGLLTGAQAEAVATYVASVAGKRG